MPKRIFGWFGKCIFTVAFDLFAKRGSELERESEREDESKGSGCFDIGIA